MDIRSLAEAVILQSLEDLQDPVWRVECIEFFHGWRFRECARLAGMDQREISRIMDMVSAQKQLYTAPTDLEDQRRRMEDTHREHPSRTRPIKCLRPCAQSTQGTG